MVFKIKKCALCLLFKKIGRKQYLGMGRQFHNQTTGYAMELLFELFVGLVQLTEKNGSWEVFSL